MTLPLDHRPVAELDNSSLSSTFTAVHAKEHPRPERKRKQSIGFELKNNQVLPIPHIDDFSKEEVADVWYEREDYEQMKKSLIPVVKRMMKGEKITETNHETARGLEFRTREGAMKRQRNKLDSIAAVLEEQHRQRIIGFSNDEVLREIYISRTAHCLKEARQLGINDEECLQRARSWKNLDKKRTSLKTRTVSLVDELRNLALARRIVNNAA